MYRTIIVFCLAFLFLAVTHLVFHSTSIEEYNVTLKMLGQKSKNMHHWLVSYEINYDIKPVKTHARKYVGKVIPKNISIVDEAGVKLDYEITGDNDYYIVWAFDKKKCCENYKVYINYTVEHPVETSNNYDSVSFDWVGRLDHSIQKASYKVIFPEGYEFKYLESSLNSYEIVKTEAGQLAIESEKFKNNKQDLHIRYMPSISDHQSYNAFYKEGSSTNLALNI